MGDKIVKSKNLCCQPVVFPSPSLLSTLKSSINEQGGLVLRITLKRACSFIRDFRVALLFGIHFSSLIVIQANVGCLVHNTKQPTLGHNLQ